MIWCEVFNGHQSLKSPITINYHAHQNICLLYCCTGKLWKPIYWMHEGGGTVEVLLFMLFSIQQLVHSSSALVRSYPGQNLLSQQKMVSPQLSSKRYIYMYSVQPLNTRSLNFFYYNVWGTQLLVHYCVHRISKVQLLLGTFFENFVINLQYDETGAHNWKKGNFKGEGAWNDHPFD